MSFDTKPIQLAVFGDPVAQSLSPRIHQCFADQFNLPIEFRKILVEENQFGALLDEFQNSGGCGCSVTVPLKELAVGLVDELSDRAAKAGAVNAIFINESGLRFGDNTDGVGLVRDIRDHHQFNLSNKSILMLGAGGVVRGMLGPLIDEKPKNILIANRTVRRAKDLADHFGVLGCGYDELGGESFDLIINGTSLSLSDELPPLPTSVLGRDTFCYDVVYSKDTTSFLRWADENGAMKLADGMGMLIEQAIDAFFLWTGRRALRSNVTQLLAQN